MKTRLSRRRRLKKRIIIISIAVVIVAAVVCGFVFLNPFAGNAEPVNTPTSTPEPTPTPTLAPTPTNAVVTPSPTADSPSPDPSTAPEPTKSQPKTGIVTLSTGTKVDLSKPMLALTFDDGPNSKVTNKILDCLKENDSHATFFMVGDRMESRSDTVKRVYNEGHQIGNHTYSHKNLKKLSASGIQEEIDKMSDIMYSIVGDRPTIVRPTYGAVNDNVKKYVEYPLILWNVDTMDWDSRNADKVYNEIMNGASDGAIILMHDLYETTGEAAVRAIPKLRDKGYQLLTISEMFEAREIQLQNGVKYFSAE